MLKSTLTAARKMQRDEKGSVAIMFGLSVIALCVVTGMAFDIGRAFASKSKVAAAVDAATLAAAKGIRLDGLTDDEAIAKAKRVFEENMRRGAGSWTNVEDVRVTIDRATSRVTVVADTFVNTTLAQLTGVTKIGAPGAATALFESRDIEVGVQLDMTGSMCSPCTKLEDLKVATKDLVNILIPSSPTAQKVRVGFAPFSAGVNPGSYLADVNGNRASSRNCVYERISSANEATDNAPVGSDAYKIREDITPPPGRSVQNCPSSEIIPLTSDRDLLKTAVDGFTATGTTAGQLGASWAWNLVSPKWKSIWPSDSTPVEYGTVNTDKVVILMTDGVYNTIDGVIWGDNSAQATTASNLSVQMCTNMKAQGITVYTVGFDLASISNVSARTRATDTLKACAGKTGHPNPEQFFYPADDGDTLRAAFVNIATDIMKLRLTN